MAKKHKTTEAEYKMLDTPAGVATPAETPVRQDWPEAGEDRELEIRLTDEDIIERSRSLIDKLRRVEVLTADKKASAEDYKAQIEIVEKQIEDLSIVVKSGTDRARVQCLWLWETNGYDAEGNPIHHSELKTLIRTDTGAIVEIKPITFEDRQVNLPLEDDEAAELKRIKLAQMGWAVKETPENYPHEEPFIGEHEDGRTVPLDADSLAGAISLLHAEVMNNLPDGTEANPLDEE